MSKQEGEKNEIPIYKERPFKLLISGWVAIGGAWILNGLGFGTAGITSAFIGLGLIIGWAVGRSKLRRKKNEVKRIIRQVY